MTQSVDTRSKEAQRVLVIGLAVTGEAVARHRAAAGDTVVVIDDRPGTTPEWDARLEAMRALGVTVLERPDAGRAAELAADADLVVPSPGVPERHPAIAAARLAEVPVRSEIDLAGEAVALAGDDAPRLVAVTGTNGKTTVTTLITEILGAAGLRVAAAGNIGRPLLDAVHDEVDVVVAEVSSFQLAFTDAVPARRRRAAEPRGRPPRLAPNLRRLRTREGEPLRAPGRRRPAGVQRRRPRGRRPRRRRARSAGVVLDRARRRRRLPGGADRHREPARDPRRRGDHPAGTTSHDPARPTWPTPWPRPRWHSTWAPTRPGCSTRPVVSCAGSADSTTACSSWRSTTASGGSTTRRRRTCTRPSLRCRASTASCCSRGQEQGARPRRAASAGARTARRGRDRRGRARGRGGVRRCGDRHHRVVHDRSGGRRAARSLPRATRCCSARAARPSTGTPRTRSGATTSPARSAPWWGWSDESDPGTQQVARQVPHAERGIRPTRRARTCSCSGSSWCSSSSAS